MMSIATVYACNIARGAQWKVSIAASVESVFRPTTPSKIKVNSNEEQTSKLSLDNWISHWSLHKTCCSCSAVGAFRLSKSVNAYGFFFKKQSWKLYLFLANQCLLYINKEAVKGQFLLNNHAATSIGAHEIQNMLLWKDIEKAKAKDGVHRF